MSDFKKFSTQCEILKTYAHDIVLSWKSDEQWALSSRDLLNEFFGNFKFDPIEIAKSSMFRNPPALTFPSLGFSHHPLTLWSSEFMSLDLYFWLPGETALHDHGFHGAFMPIIGEYAQTTYNFAAEIEIAKGIEAGKFSKNETQILPTHKAEAIFHAPKFIHQVTHESRCVTLCLRSRFGGVRLSDYYQPGLKVSAQCEASIAAHEDLQRLSILNEFDTSSVPSLIKSAPDGVLYRWWLSGVQGGHQKKLKGLFEEELRMREHGNLILEAQIVLS
ncbi:MAG: hypothetical protein K2P81_03105 [Bacteriovoracaceae bacterium]|nr:hypothetical protein [Bacteriovoracaceae bacterium]